MSHNKKDWVVYKHTFPNEKIYIGITSQKDLNRRWRNGQGYLRKQPSGEYNQPLIARAILKYGWDNILHEVVCDKLTKKDAEHMEQDLIAKYKSSDSRYGYNIRSGGSVNSHLSDETKKKISKANKGKRKGEDSPHWGKKRTEESKKRQSEHHADMNGGKNPRAKKVAQYSIDGSFIRLWDCAMDISKELCFDNSTIGKCCKGYIEKAYGFIWRYYIEELEAV